MPWIGSYVSQAFFFVSFCFGLLAGLYWESVSLKNTLLYLKNKSNVNQQ
jgi:hypothetical protein